MKALEWKQLITEHLSSGLSVKEFCLSKGIKIKTFYKKRAAMGLSPYKREIIKSSDTSVFNQNNIPSFIKATIDHQADKRIFQVTQRAYKGNQVISLIISNELRLQLNEQVSIRWLASLIKELA